MPPNLGVGWPAHQFEALIAYFRATESLEGGAG
jgi:hypothetical protein